MDIKNKKFRNEMKYYLNTFEFLALKSKVATFLPLDSNSLSLDGYTIRSLYFDGIHNHALYDKNDGVFNREKYRIRIYNGSDQKINLERKSKYGDYVCKESAPLTRVEYDAISEGDASVLANKEHPLLKDFYSALEHRGFRPVVIVEYVREAYVFEPGNVRITFDKQLTAGVSGVDLFDDHIIYEEVLLPEQTILEVKFDEFLPDVIRQLVQPEKIVRSAISKYVLCKEKTIKHFK